MEPSDENYKKVGYAEDYANKLNRDIHNEVREKIRRRMNHDNSTGRVLGGLVIVGIGSVYMARQMGVEFPHWLFTWPMILIVIAIFLGAKHSFRIGGWVGLFAIGALFLFDEMNGMAFHQYIWPIAIITFGLLMIIRPKRKKKYEDWALWENTGPFSKSAGNATADDSIDSTSIFGGNKKNIISKDFKGGDITTFFGGMELNLSQADINGSVTLDITQFFGGTKLVLPSNWRIKSDIITIFGSFEDKRQLVTDMPETNKVLVLSGTCVFGGIDIKSY